MLLLDGDAGGREGIDYPGGAGRTTLGGTGRAYLAVTELLSKHCWSRCELTQVSLSSFFVQVGTHTLASCQSACHVMEVKTFIP